MVTCSNNPRTLRETSNRLLRTVLNLVCRPGLGERGRGSARAGVGGLDCVWLPLGHVSGVWFNSAAVLCVGQAYEGQESLPVYRRKSRLTELMRT